MPTVQHQTAVEIELENLVLPPAGFAIAASLDPE
jgi:hypothetical protein